MLLCREMPMAAVTEALGEHDTRLWRVAAHYVEGAHAKNSWAKVRAIIESLASQLHEMEAVKDDLGLREEAACSASCIMAELKSMLMSSIWFSLSAVGHQRLSEGIP